MPPTDDVLLNDSGPQERSDAQQPDLVPEDVVGLTHHKGTTKVALSGVIGLSAVETLHEYMVRLADGQQDFVVVDCSQVEHLPAAALQVLLAAQATLGNGKRQLRIESESPAIRDYLQLAGLAERFPAQEPDARRRRKRTSKVVQQP